MKTKLALLILVVLVTPTALFAQDTVSTAKTLYQSAAYDEALSVLDRLKPSGVAQEAQTMAQLRAYCLLALNRQSEAEAAIEQVVRNDLFFVPSESDVSPRVRTNFQSVRRRVLPDAVRAEYATAKAAFDRREFPAAIERFERVLSLLADPQMDRVPGVDDLRTLGAGFRDLARAAMAPPAAAAPEQAAPAPPPPPPVDLHKVYDLNEPGIVPPVAERQEIPDFPGRTTATALNRRAILDIVIDENGRVEKVSLKPRMDARYDAMLLNAAMTWRYKPARLASGQSVKFYKRLQITIQ